MWTSLRWLMISALAVGWLGFLSPAQAAKDRAIPIKDAGKFFSEKAIEQANKKIEQIKLDYKKDLAIETIASVPEKDAKEAKENTQRYFRDYARKRYGALGISGIYVIISREPRFVFVESGKETEKKAFTTADCKAAANLLLTHFKKKEAGRFDEGLLALVNDVDKTLDRNIGKGAAETGRSGATKTSPQRGSGGSGGFMDGIWGWVCIGIVVLLGIWLVFGLIRAFTGSGGGGGGPGGPGGGGYGGGGGGFFPSLMGGLFGAAAGLWMYDSFFRSHTPTDPGGGAAYGGSPTGADDTTAGGGAGGDWGDDAGGGGGGGGDWGDEGGGGGGDWGDAGGGGGDWGGGGDVGGGGGDWGGGGDFGGGGGGDW